MGPALLAKSNPRPSSTFSPPATLPLLDQVFPPSVSRWTFLLVLVDTESPVSLLLNVLLLLLLKNTMLKLSRKVLLGVVVVLLLPELLLVIVWLRDWQSAISTFTLLLNKLSRLMT